MVTGMIVRAQKQGNQLIFVRYCGAFEWLVCPGRRAFASLFSKNPSLGWGGGGGGLNARTD